MQTDQTINHKDSHFCCNRNTSVLSSFMLRHFIKNGEENSRLTSDLLDFPLAEENKSQPRCLGKGRLLSRFSDARRWEQFTCTDAAEWDCGGTQWVFSCLGCRKLTLCLG